MPLVRQTLQADLQSGLPGLRSQGLSASHVAGGKSELRWWPLPLPQRTRLFRQRWASQLEQVSEAASGIWPAGKRLVLHANLRSMVGVEVCREIESITNLKGE